MVNQIRLDIPRTFSGWKIKNFSAPVNPLENVLMAYALDDPELGYTQGMNFLVGMILIGVNFDEVVAFKILYLLMRDRNWRRVYTENLSGLFSLTDKVQSWLEEAHPDLQAHFENHFVPLATLLAGPFMSLFSNILDLENSMHVFDLFISGGHKNIIAII